MLRRNADNLLEFLQLEQVLAAAAPRGLVGNAIAEWAAVFPGLEW